MSNSVRARVTNAKIVKTGVDSNHSTIKLKLCLKVSLKCKKKHRTSRKIVPDWDRLKKQPDNVLAFQAEVNRLLAKMRRKTFKYLNSAIMEAGKATVPRCSRNRQDWYKASKKLLFAAIQARTKHSVNCPPIPPRSGLRTPRRHETQPGHCAWDATTTMPNQLP
jgi:hypothetical protein